MMNITGWWLTYPSEKWWSLSVGIMKFPTEWQVIKFHGSKPPTSINMLRLCKTHGDHQRWPRNDIAIMSRKLVPPASAFQRTPRISSNLLSKQLGWTKGCRIVVVVFFASGFFFGTICLVFALYLQQYHLPWILQQFWTRTCHFAWYLLHFGMVTLHFAWYLLHVAMSAFHFAWYLSHLGISTSHLHGICFFWYFKRSCGSLEGSLGFHLGFYLRFHLGFHFRFYSGLHLGYHLGFHFRFL